MIKSVSLIIFSNSVYCYVEKSSKASFTAACSINLYPQLWIIILFFLINKDRQPLVSDDVNISLSITEKSSSLVELCKRHFSVVLFRLRSGTSKLKLLKTSLIKSSVISTINFNPTNLKASTP